MHDSPPKRLDGVGAGAIARAFAAFAEEAGHHLEAHGDFALELLLVVQPPFLLQVVVLGERVIEPATISAFQLGAQVAEPPPPEQQCADCHLWAARPAEVAAAQRQVHGIAEQIIAQPLDHLLKFVQVALERVSG